MIIMNYVIFNITYVTSNFRPYHANALVLFAQFRSDERRDLAPQERLYGHRHAQVLQAIIRWSGSFRPGCCCRRTTVLVGLLVGTLRLIHFENYIYGFGLLELNHNRFVFIPHICIVKQGIL